MMELRFGTTRTVLLLWRWAFKVPSTVEWRLFLLGLVANMQEAQFSRIEEWRHKLCPVLFAAWGGWVIVMPRCISITDEEFLSIPDEWWIVDRFELQDHEGDILPVERKTCSFGWLNGRLVAVDYGN